jgi:hypothetical protein
VTLLARMAWFQKGIHWVQMAAGIFLVGLAWQIGKPQFELLREGVRTSGRIVRVDYLTPGSTRGFGGSWSAFYPVVEFSVAGRKLQFRDRIGSSSGSGTNDTVPVLYKPGEPGVAMIDRPVFNWIPWAPSFAVGAFLLVVGAIGQLRKSTARDDED